MVNEEYNRKRYSEGPAGLMTGKELAKCLQEQDLYIANRELNSPENMEKLDPITWQILWSALSYTIAHYKDFMYWLKGSKK